MQIADFPELVRRAFGFLIAEHGFRWLPETVTFGGAAVNLYAERPDGHRFWFGYCPGRCEFDVTLDLHRMDGTKERIPLPALSAPPPLWALGIAPSDKHGFEDALSEVAERLKSGLPSTL